MRVHRYPCRCYYPEQRVDERQHGQGNAGVRIQEQHFLHFAARLGAERSSGCDVAACQAGSCLPLWVSQHPRSVAVLAEVLGALRFPSFTFNSPHPHTAHTYLRTGKETYSRLNHLCLHFMRLAQYWPVWFRFEFALEFLSHVCSSSSLLPVRQRR